MMNVAITIASQYTAIASMKFMKIVRNCDIPAGKTVVIVGAAVKAKEGNPIIVSKAAGIANIRAIKAMKNEPFKCSSIFLLASVL